MKKPAQRHASGTIRTSRLSHASQPSKISGSPSGALRQTPFKTHTKPRTSYRIPSSLHPTPLLNLYPIPPKLSTAPAKPLNCYESTQIQGYPEVYFLGQAPKAEPDLTEENFGFSQGGIYKAAMHDHIAYRYQLLEPLATGNFSHVFKAFDHKDKEMVALKIIKNICNLYEYSLTEIKILRSLAKTFPTNNFAVNLLNSFTFRNHRVLVFPLLCKTLFQLINSRPVLKVRRLAYQILCGISQIHARGVIHCDLKPENIMLANAKCSSVKIIDFGISCYKSNKPFHYTQSRHYRAPEVLLDCPYSFPIDMWGFGCVLFEMITGSLLFKGENEHQQLLSIMEFRGYPPSELLQRSKKVLNYFTSIYKVKVVRDCAGNLKEPGSRNLKFWVDDPVALDLIEACLAMDPGQRVTAAEALNHPFFVKKRRVSSSGVPQFRQLS